MMALSFLVVLLCIIFPGILCQAPDPMCKNKICPPGQICRQYKPCGLQEKCNLTTICVDDAGTRRDGCMIGYPILYTENNSLTHVVCYKEAPCPSNAYCSSIVMDVSSVCCLSDAVKTVRAGTCPAPKPDPSQLYFVDSCNSDGDCYPGEKCCNIGFTRKCEYIPMDLQNPPVEIITPAAPPSGNPCDGKVCPQNQKCRLFKPCGQFQQCNVTSICTDSTIREAGCKTGYPILLEKNGAPSLLTCYSSAPCPSNAYCSTELMDVSSACCLSDPAKTVKLGTCPSTPTNYDSLFCVDQCKSDGDCHWNDKCCNTGCKKECVPPAEDIVPIPPVMTTEPCESIKCPRGSYCRRRNQLCRTPWNCLPEGHCIACEPPMSIHPRLGLKIVFDPDGCAQAVPIVQRRPMQTRRPNPLTVFLMWLYNNI